MLGRRPAVASEDSYRHELEAVARWAAFLEMLEAVQRSGHFCEYRHIDKIAFCVFDETPAGEPAG